MSEAKQVMIFPRGQLKPRDRKTLADNGVLAVEADDPSAVVQAIPGTALVGADDMMMAALYAITGNEASIEHQKFVADLYRRIKAREDRAAASLSDSRDAVKQGGEHG